MISHSLKGAVSVKNLRPINNRKLINIINFYTFIFLNLCDLNKSDFSENQYFKIFGATPDEQTKFLNYFTLI